MNLIGGMSARQSKDFNDLTLIENKNGENTLKIAYIFYSQISSLNQKLNAVCKGNLKSVYISKDNAISQHRDFLDACISDVKQSLIIDISSKAPSHHITNENPIHLKEFKNWCRKSLENVLELATQELGVSILSHCFQIDNLDIEKHGLSKKVYKRQAPTFDCVRYAFYKLGESKVESWLFAKTDQNPLASGNILTTLTGKFDYFVVTDPQEHDLIIYLDELQNPIHFGVMSDSQTVHSKWGKLPQIFSHPIHSSPYGNFFITLRKK